MTKQYPIQFIFIFLILINQSILILICYNHVHSGDMIIQFSLFYHSYALGQLLMKVHWQMNYIYKAQIRRDNATNISTNENTLDILIPVGHSFDHYDIL